MKQLSLRLITIIIAAIGTSFFLWTLLDLSYSRNAPTTSHTISHQFCQRPKLDISNPQISKYLKTPPHLKCSQEPDWVTVSKGSVWANPETVKTHGPFECSLDMYERIDDYKSKIGKMVKFSSSAKSASLEADFFQISCKAKDGKKWENIMAAVHKNPDVLGRVGKGARSKEHWNVLMFGLDSMSRLHYMRKLPKTYKFLTEELGAVILEGYNIVGDGTPQALIPILTGFTEPELPDTRKRNKGTDFVNVYPFVWKNFSAHNYVTAWAEDTASVAIFTYRLNGFKEQPTDHYMRPFYVEAETKFSKHEPRCLGNTTRHQVMLNWLRQLYEVYPDNPKFAFGFHGELSHDDFNLVGVADDDLVSYVRGLRDDKYLDNTFLILMSDHGHRYTNMRTLAQGKQEERLPFFSIAVPTAFRLKYPGMVFNLEINAQRLTTPFDLYPTFLDILNPSSFVSVGDGNKRSISLFSEIPEERTCAQAGIDPHFCTCLSWKPISPTSKVAKEASQTVVDFINDYTSPHKSQCAHLTLAEVTRAEQFEPNEDLLKYKGVVDKDGFEPDLTDTIKTEFILYQVQLSVHPSDGIYEASVKYDLKLKTFSVDVKEISRINLYGKQPHCVQDRFPDLRKYCFCKVQAT